MPSRNGTSRSFLSAIPLAATPRSRSPCGLRKDNIPVELVITVDPTRAGPLSKNVKRYVNYYFSGNGLGSKLKARSGVSSSRIKNIDMRKRDDVVGEGDDHWTVTNNDAIQSEILRAVRRAAR